ncbi:MAG: peptidase S58 [Acidobacteria bacterium RIFCSPLOWO2_02_FULL_65_29]|nr:MAG: peptidase S58 [Acidobacteria bacterium RIFCSPLOWO2_02_FULL_65_29]
MRTLAGWLAASIALAAPPALTVDAQPANHTLTSVAGIRVGHHTLPNAPTGCTVILAETGATAGVDVRGMAPASAETDLLNPVNLVQQVHAITLSGRSAFGLDARSGVMRYLEERQIGVAFGRARVPIVPAASLFDLGVGDPLVRPTADCGYQAAKGASDAPVVDGSVGAGAGATLGKAAGLSRALKSGVGSAAITLSSGLTVAALVVVNAFGDVIDPATGQVVAGVRTMDGNGFADARKLVRAGSITFGGGGNTTLGVIATNATLTKTQATRVAEMAHDGYARAISPVHTPVDGDLIFALATNARPGAADVGIVGALAAEMMAEAILRAVRQATGVQGIPALRDLLPP